MRIFSAIFVLLVFTVFVAAQTNIPLSNERINLSVDKLLEPEKSDKAEAKKLGVKVFRILPRETYDGNISLRGGGAYYSFVPRTGSFISPYDNVPSSKISNGLQASGGSLAPMPIQGILSPHYYGYGSDLEFQRGKFSVGFGGADYGFLYDLGEISLDKISLKSPEVVFLDSYDPPSKMKEVRVEQSRTSHTPAYEANGFGYKRSVSAVVGHSYVLRSINFGDSDVLVALKVYRQDTDGSLIVFWKKLRTFLTPDID